MFRVTVLVMLNASRLTAYRQRSVIKWVEPARARPTSLIQRREERTVSQVEYRYVEARAVNQAYNHVRYHAPAPSKCFEA